MADKKHTTVILQKDYRPLEGDFQYPAGHAVELPPDEAKGLLDSGLALTPGDAEKSEDERRAIRTLTDLGYTVDEPRKDGKK